MAYEWTRMDNGDERRTRGGCFIERWGESRSANVVRRIDGITYLTRTLLRYGQDEAIFDALCDAAADELDAMVARFGAEVGL